MVSKINPEVSLINHILKTRDIVTPLNADAEKSFSLYRDEWDFIKEYYTKHREVPPPSLYQDKFEGWEAYNTDGAIEFYIEELHKWKAKHTLQQIITDAAMGIKSDGGPFTTITTMQKELAKLGRDTRMVRDLDLVGSMDERLENFRERLELRKSGKNLLGIPSGFKSIDDAMGGWQRGDFIVLAAWTGQGKALRNGTPVLTRKYGWRSINRLEVGDEVFSADGTITNITGVFPQGVRPLYTLSLSDGTDIDADEEHLWQVVIRGRDNLLTTKEIFDNYNGRDSRYQPILPLVAPIKHDHVDMCIDPYSLGVLLGDGSMTLSDITISMTTLDFEEIRQHLQLKITERANQYSYGVVGERENLLELGLLGKKSEDKFIPFGYLHNSIDSRIAILRGLMDTDGTVDNQDCSFSSSSLDLAEGVASLVRSLGGKAKIRTKPTKHLDNYIVRIWLDLCPFMLDRKTSLWWKHHKNKSVTKAVRIRSVVRTDDDEATCITVDHPSSLFVTKNYVVTHNSWLAMKMAQHAWNEGYRVLYFSLEMSGLQIGYRFDTILSGSSDEGITNTALTHAQDITYDHYKNWLGEIMYDKHPFIVVTNEDLDEVTQNTVLAKIDQWKPDLCVLDYVGLFDDSSGAIGETEKLKNLSKAFKRIGIKTGVPIIAITSVTMPDGHGERLPELHELAWSKQLGYDSDLCMTMVKRGNVLEVASKKTRRCPDFSLYVNADFDKGIFKEMGRDSIFNKKESDEED